MLLFFQIYGICGKFNYKSRDDFTSSSEVEVTSVSDFVGSFAIADAVCVTDVRDSMCTFVNSTVVNAFPRL